MNKEQREPYLFLANFPEPGWGLCNCCRFAEFDGYSECDCSLECKHPLDVINGFRDDGEHANAVWGEGADCWGFRPNCSLQELGIKASIRSDGNIPHWSNKYKEYVAIIPSERERAMF